MQPFASLVMVLMAAAMPAQIPIAKFVNTYSASRSRGFYFQAPTTLVLTHAQVPDETGKGKQIIAIYKMTGPPPAFPGTVPVTPLAFVENLDSKVRWQLPVPVIFSKGDWVAVLGVCGPSTGVVSNSRGTPNFASEVLGFPITLQRCGIQANIGVANGVGGMWSENRNPAVRIRVTFAGSPASETHCTPSNGTAALGICDDKPAIAGKNLGLTIRSGGATHTSVALAIGINRASTPIPGFGTLCANPIPIVVFGLPAATAAGRNYVFPIPKPSGGTINLQAALLGGTTSPLTNGLEVTVGN